MTAYTITRLTLKEMELLREEAYRVFCLDKKRYLSRGQNDKLRQGGMVDLVIEAEKVLPEHRRRETAKRDAGRKFSYRSYDYIEEHIFDMETAPTTVVTPTVAAVQVTAVEQAPVVDQPPATPVADAEEVQALSSELEESLAKFVSRFIIESPLFKDIIANVSKAVIAEIQKSAPAPASSVQPVIRAFRKEDDKPATPPAMNEETRVSTIRAVSPIANLVEKAVVAKEVPKELFKVFIIGTEPTISRCQVSIDGVEIEYCTKTAHLDRFEKYIKSCDLVLIEPKVSNMVVSKVRPWVEEAGSTYLVQGLSHSSVAREIKAQIGEKAKKKA